MCESIQNLQIVQKLCVSLSQRSVVFYYNVSNEIHARSCTVVEIKEILTRIGYVRNKANLSAREVSLRMGMSPQYVAQVESGRIVLTVEKLLQILSICDFSIERFFSSNIDDYNVDTELKELIESLPSNKKKNIIEFIKK